VDETARSEVRVAGFGGQGVITTGYVLANAASIYDGANALMTQSYGPEARGGACRADVIISDEIIDYPKISGLDCLVALSADAYYKFKGDVREGGVVVYEESLISIPEADKEGEASFHGIPAVDEARVLGNPLSANMVILGATLEITGAVGFESVREAVRERFPKYAEVNVKALERGRELARASPG
jgi:2-oxoglutarate ferredoxin oxidoreductase subunit gamma